MIQQYAMTIATIIVIAVNGIWCAAKKFLHATRRSALQLPTTSTTRHAKPTGSRGRCPRAVVGTLLLALYLAWSGR